MYTNNTYIGPLYIYITLSLSLSLSLHIYVDIDRHIACIGLFESLGKGLRLWDFWFRFHGGRLWVDFSHPSRLTGS